MKMVKNADTRSIEVELEIDAPVDAVWKALTDPEELTRWFPLEARVEPGPGGAIAMSWGPEAQGESRIRIWEPGSRLETTWFEPTKAFGETGDFHSKTFRDDPETARRLVVDYRLEGSTGATSLRMVHSGFGLDSRWDDEYEGHGRGWNFELRSLRNYLEHHLGQSRQVSWSRQAVSGDLSVAWDRLMSKDGLLAEGSLQGATPGSRWAVTTVHGARLEGEVIADHAPVEFAGTVENRGHSLLRCGVDRSFGQPEASMWLSSWGEHRGQAESFQADWNKTLAQLFQSP